MRRNEELLMVLRMESEVRRCIESGSPCDLGMIRVELNRGLFRKRAVIVLGNRAISIEEFDSLVSKAKSLVQWYENDCSIEALSLEFTGMDHAEKIIQFMEANRDRLLEACSGKAVNLIIEGVPDYVNEGMWRAIRNQ
jgi:hypothetical protein